MFGRKKKDVDGKRAVTQDVTDDDLVTDEPLDDEPTAAELDDARADADDLLDDDELAADPEESGDLEDEDLLAADEDDDADVEEAADDDADDEGAADDTEDDEDDVDEWEELQQSRDWRDDGPFDIDEVELEGDEVQRIDFGSLIITPLDNMQLQLQVDQETQAVQAALAMKDNSGLELALFAAPRSGGLAKTVRDEMLAAVDQIGGSCECAEGPFGVEMRRIVPVTAPDGQDALHVSRTWLAEGPRWLLRGVLMGQAALPTEDGSPSQEAEAEFVEFFKNVIVRRGDVPQPPGELIPMTLPDELQPPQA